MIVGVGEAHSCCHLARVNRTPPLGPRNSFPLPWLVITWDFSKGGKTVARHPRDHPSCSWRAIVSICSAEYLFSSTYYLSNSTKRCINIFGERDMAINLHTKTWWYIYIIQTYHTYSNICPIITYIQYILHSKQNELYNFSATSYNDFGHDFVHISSLVRHVYLQYSSQTKHGTSSVIKPP